jgi:hypothetical protein
MLGVIEQIISFFTQNPIIALLTGGYFAITFGDSSERKRYFERTYRILISPTKLEEYENAPSSLASFETWLKRIMLLDVAKAALDGLAGNISTTFKVTWKKYVGWLFLIFMLIVFLIADLITIREIAILLGFPINFSSVEFLSFLESFDYGFAITVGTFFTIISSGFVLLEVTGKKSEFSDFQSDTYDKLRDWIKYSALFTLVSSLLVVIFFGLRAYAVAAVLPDNIANAYNDLAQFGGNVLVRVNAFVITALIATESLNGLQSVLIVLVLLCVALLEVFYLLTGLITIILRFIADLLYRTFLWLLWTLSFWIAKPVDKLLTPIKFLWDKIFGKYTKSQSTTEELE